MLQKHGLKCIDLFCGAGGFSLGLMNAGLTPVLAFDHSAPALAQYNRNIAPHAEVADLSDVHAVIARIKSSKIPAIDIIVGGPPCQDFSTAGKNIEGRRASLTESFARIVAGISPRFFIMENVPNALKSKAFQTAVANLRTSGYDFVHAVLNAADYGAPQLRKRLFVFGWNENNDNNDRSIAFKSELERLATTAGNPVTVKQYLKHEISVNCYYRHACNYARRSVFTVDEPSPTIRTVNRPVPPGYPRHKNDSADPADVGPLSTYQRARVQTFPASWDWGIKSNERVAKVETCIGNAVPPLLAEVVGKAVVASI